MEQNEHIEAWWNTLDEEKRQRLLELDESETLPAEFVPSMVDAHVLVVGTKWTADPGYSFHQPESLVAFLAERRGQE
ncbi:hypothetical protein ACIQWR_28585 [Streptomyces sp. NPDC098789]|uniref:hypothetical protein n=1 Tax=Streptomyces sp. NPDC098789 TaxID=3366098 RepID=UPI00382219EF